RWTEELEVFGRSYGYVAHLRQRYRDYIKPFFKGHDVTSIRTLNVREFSVHLHKRKFATKTIKHILDALHTFLRYCHDLELIEQVPRFPNVKVIPREKAWISTDAQRRILARIPAHEQLVFLVMVETGIRPSEGAALKVKDFIDGGVVIRRALDSRGYPKETKTGSETFRALSKQLYSQIMKQIMQLFPEDWMFKYNGERLTRRRLGYVWTMASKAEGLKISLYQGTRHSKASQKREQLQLKMNKELSRELGHSSPVTTLKHYALKKEDKIG
ncbi:MAG: tyrosine-type recombinase/integrase, partial [Gammaproteobacteria bacterium]|nr:tyrosine-type recombinase/integrase [Gammaproteobacteria bacterium]